ncbi:28S rRNA (cytosine-C(5))-methyltransferase-like [Glandiceps talaboti]
MLYFEAATIIDEVKKKKGSVKSLVLGGKFKNKKQLFALVCETLKYTTLIDKILRETKLLQREKFLKKNPTLAQVLVYEHLFGKGIQCGGRLKAAVKGHRAALQASLSRMKIKAKVTENEDLLPKEITQQVQLPRYVRVNLLKTTLKDVIQHFIKEDYILTSRKDKMRVELEKMNGQAELISEMSCNLIKSLKRKHFMIDLHLPDLLVFAAKTDLHDHVLYQQGDIILQDKASCIPAQALSPPPGSHVIDTCAAPGNKTTHLASIMNNTGKIFAFDLDTKRLGTMGSLTAKAGVMNTQLHNQDFLKTNPNDPKYKKVEYILVDPSCSGSGIVSRKDYLTESAGDDGNGKSKERMESLARFQINILSHAMEFPSVKRLVYSTCSVHVEENEEVVEKVLEQNKEFVLSKPLPTWAHRGVKESSIGEYCLRASPDQDRTNGFFVALFERKDVNVKVGNTNNNTTGEVELDISEECSEKNENTQTLGDSQTSSSQGQTSSSQGQTEVKKKRNKKKRKVTENVESVTGDSKLSKQMKLAKIPFTDRIAKKKKTKKRKKKTQPVV